MGEYTAGFGQCMQCVVAGLQLSQGELQFEALGQGHVDVVEGWRCRHLPNICRGYWAATMASRAAFLIAFVKP